MPLQDRRLAILASGTPALMKLCGRVPEAMTSFAGASGAGLCILYANLSMQQRNFKVRKSAADGHV